jgi:hypothetical protein
MDETPVKRKRPDVTERLNQRKGKDTSVVQVGWTSLCSDPAISKRIEEIIPEVTRIRVETCLLLNMHFIRLMEAGRDLPVIDQNLVGRAMQCTHSKRVVADPDLVETFRVNFLPYCPNRPPSSCLPRISKILEDLRNSLITNIRNNIAVHFEARHRQFLDTELQQSIAAVPFFTEEKDRTSCVRLLVRATLKEPETSFLELLPNYPRIRDKIPQEAQQVLRRLIDLIRPLVGPLPADPLKLPHLYLPWMRTMGIALQAQGKRSFSLIPHASFAAPFIAITPTTLCEIMPKGGKRKLETTQTTLSDHFSIARLSSSGKRFANHIITNGVSASVTFLVDARPELAEVTEVVPVHVHPGQRVVGLDPGKSPDFLTGAVFEGSWDGQGPQDETLHFSNRRFYHDAGFKKRSFLMSKWMKEDVDVHYFNEQAPPRGCMDSESLGRRIEAVQSSLYSLIRFHTARRVRKLRRTVTIQKQRMVDKVCSIITGGKKTVVAFGAAKVGSTKAKGHPCGPCEAVKRRLSSHHAAHLIMVNEYNTSKRCSACWAMLGAFKVPTRRRVVEDGIRTISEESMKTCHNVRACINPLCRIVWNRDVNAARSMAYLCLNGARGLDRPAEFKEADR